MLIFAALRSEFSFSYVSSFFLSVSGTGFCCIGSEVVITFMTVGDLGLVGDFRVPIVEILLEDVCRGDVLAFSEAMFFFHP